MTQCTRIITVSAFIISMVLPAWGQQYLFYTPQPLPPGEKAPSQDGIMVQEIEIMKGDTLYDFSRKFSGHGMYFSQILLFNSIKNPNLIYTGKTLRIPLNKKGINISARRETPKTSKVGSSEGKEKSKLPVRRSAAALPVSHPNPEDSLRDPKTIGTTQINAAPKKDKPSAQAKKSTAPLPLLPAAATTGKTGSSEAVSAAEQQLFESAVKAYRKDDCLAAINLLDRYLSGYSSSPLAAEASLYRAECYLKLSAQ